MHLKKIIIGLIVTFLIICLSIPLFLYFLLPNEQDYRLDGLHPEVEAAKTELIKKAEEHDIQIRITQGFRSFAEQDALYAQGRTRPGNIVTHATGGRSYHNYGLAIDFVVIDPKTKQPTWDTTFDGNQNGESDWVEVAKEGKKLGFDWGGDWHGWKDIPHLEMTFGHEIWQLYLKVKLKKRLDS